MSEQNPMRDPLTGCGTAAAFASDLENMLAKAGESYSDLTLVMIDTDNFMHVNTDFGHPTGDEVLKEIARELITGVPTHSVYRYSGDQFAVIFPNAEKESVFLLTDKTREKISSSGECERTSTTVSIGIATYPEDGTRQPDLIRKANDALYRAKISGRNKVALAKEDKLVTKTAHYTVEQLKRLKDLSESSGVNEAALMREALDELLKKCDTQKVPQPPKGGKTVLIVDDAPFMRGMLKDILTMNRLTVIGECQNGAEAVEPYEKMTPDYILLELDTPVTDGITFLKTINKRENTKIIVVSNTADPRSVTESVKYGADAYIVKPFAADCLIKIMSGIDHLSLTPSHHDALVREFESMLTDPDGTQVKLTQTEIDSAWEKCLK
ncbi:hypothetical protein FACS1894105_03190 [Clostridia bacterium]|nr:hypothetical protein FACS1894105_03190 [Clostridia bacterium]